MVATAWTKQAVRARFRAALRAFRGVSDAIAPVGLLDGVLRGDPPARGTHGYLTAYSSMPWLRAVTHRIASSTASVRWQLYAVRRQGRFRRMPALAAASPTERQRWYKAHAPTDELIELDEHPLLTVLHQLNPLLTGYATRKLTQVYLDLVGEAGWLLQRNAMGMIETAWPIPPTWVHTLPTPDTPAYRVQFAGWQGLVPESEMLWFRDADPVNPYGRGSGTAQALADELDTDEYAAKHVRQWFYNRARPDIVIAPKDSQAEINEPSLTRLKERWLQEHQAFWKAYRPFFSSRAIDVHEIGQTFEQMQLIELRQFERDMCIEVFGVPPEVLGILSSSNRATIESADYLFTSKVVVPRLELQRSIMQTCLIPQYDERLILDYVSPVVEDREFALRAAQAAPHTLTANEWRELAGHARREDGDVFYVPFTSFVQSSLGGTTTPPRQASPQNAVTMKQARHTDEPADDGFYRVLHRIADQLEPALRREFVEAISRVREAIDLQAIQQALTAGMLQAALDALPWDQLEAALGTTMTVMLQRAFLAAGDATAQEMHNSLSIDVAFNQEDARAQEWAQQHGLALASQEGLTGESREAIRQLITEAFAQETMPGALIDTIQQSLGLTRSQLVRLQRFRQALRDDGASPADIQRRTERLADALLAQRAETIARTELINAVSEGQQQAWQQADAAGLIGPAFRRFWIVTPDDRLDTAHCEPVPSMNREGVGLHEPFRTPLGPRLRPTLHPNCRCSVSLRRVD